MKLTKEFKAEVMNAIKNPVSMFELERPGEKLMEALVKAGFLPQPQLQPVRVKSQTSHKVL